MYYILHIPIINNIVKQRFMLSHVIMKRRNSGENVFITMNLSQYEILPQIRLCENKWGLLKEHIPNLCIKITKISKIYLRTKTFNIIYLVESSCACLF